MPVPSLVDSKAISFEYLLKTVKIVAFSV